MDTTRNYHISSTHGSLKHLCFFSKTAKNTGHSHGIWGSNKDPGLCTPTVWHLLYCSSTNSIRILMLLVKKVARFSCAIIAFYIRNQLLHRSPEWKLSPRICITHKKHIKVPQNFFTDFNFNIYLQFFTSFLNKYLLSFKKTLDYTSPGLTIVVFAMREDP